MDARGLDTLERVLPRGRANATTVADLTYRLELNHWGVSPWSDRSVREGLEQLISERRVPVVTLPTNPGVFVAVTPEELDLADANLKSRAMALLVRRRNLRRCKPQLVYRETLFDLEGVA